MRHPDIYHSDSAPISHPISVPSLAALMYSHGLLIVKITVLFFLFSFLFHSARMRDREGRFMLQKYHSKRALGVIEKVA